MALFKHVGKRLASAYQREKVRTIEQWAEQEVEFRNLEVSPVLGKFRVKYSPHYRKLFKLVERTLTREIFAKWASQSGKSLFGVLVAAWKLDTLPATVIYAQPLKEDVSTILQTKINPVLESIPNLWKKFEDYKEKEKKRTKDAAKKLAGGNFLVKGSGVKDRKSQTSPFIVGDEIGEFERGAMFEFKERTKSFTKFHPKVIGLSTIVDPEDEICTNFDACSVKIEWHYVCRECGNHFYPDISLFKYKSKSDYMKENGLEETDVILNKYIDEAKATVHMECPHCYHKINTAEKDKMIEEESMDWFIKRENGTYDLLVVEELTTETSFGVDMNSFGSFFVTYEDIVENIIKAGTDETKLEKLWRGWFNRFYESKINKTDSSDVALLANDYDEFVIPEDTIGLYMGVDSQKGYYWVTIVAITYGVNTHLIWAGRVEDESTLETFMDREYYYTDGKRYIPGIRRAYHDWQGFKDITSETVVNDDTGEVVEVMGLDMPQRVKEFAYKMAEKYGADKDGRERYYAVRGEQFLTNDEPFKYTTTEVTISNYKDTRKIKTLRINTTAMKTSFMSSLMRNIAKQKAEEDDEAYTYSERLHYINKTLAQKLKDRTRPVNTDYDKQITSETYANHPNAQGKPDKYKTWKGNKDNHYLDTNSYIQVAIIQDNLASMKKPEPTKEAFKIARSLI